MPRTRLSDPTPEVEVEKDNYFLKTEKAVDFIPTGCTLLDRVIGGGWPMARIVNIAGDEATGKCARDYYVLSSKGLIHSDELELQFPSGVTELNLELAVGRYKTVIATHSYKEEVCSTIRFVTRRGFELIATPDHKVKVLKSDLSQKMVKMSDLEEGDQIIIVPQSGIFPKSDVNLNINVVTRKSNRTESITLPSHMTPSLAGLLGIFVADGSLSVPGIEGITAHKKWKRDVLKELIPNAIGVDARYNDTTFHFNAQMKKSLPALFGVETLAGCTSTKKFVPTTIRYSTKECQREFLKTLLSFDGFVGTGNFEYTTASKRLARDIQMMLLNFDVVTTLSEKSVKLDMWSERRIYYRLFASGSEFNRLVDNVGLIKPVKRASDRKCSDYDSIPYVLDCLVNEINKVRKELGWTANGKLKNGNTFPRTKVISHSSKGYNGLSREFLLKELELLYGFLSEDFVKKCENLLEEGFLFDPIISIETIEGNQIVTDVHIPENHLFWCSGMISHNTLLCIEASRNFKTKYPDGRVFYREAESAFDEDYAAAIGMPVEEIDFLDPDVDFNTVEDFYKDIDKCISICEKDNTPGLYILDSLDALSDEEEMKREFNKGSYGTQKAKNMSKAFRMITRRAAKANMAIIIISQTRDKISDMGLPGKTKGGGKAVNFYSSVILWLSHVQTMARVRAGIKRAYAIRVKVRCSKNKISLAHRQAEFVITFGQGIDDVQSNNDWLEDLKKDTEVFGVTRKTHDKHIEAMSDKEYWKEADRVADAVSSIWIEADRLQLQDVRRRRD